MYAHLTRTLSTIPSTTKNTAIKHCITETILNSTILAVIAIFATQMMAKPQLSALKLGGRQSKSGIDTGDRYFIYGKCNVTTLTIDATAITPIKTVIYSLVKELPLL